MGESLNFLPGSTKEEAGNLSPLILAFLGDTVFETAIRTMVVSKSHSPVGILNRTKNRYARADAQSLMVDAILPHLTPEEEQIYRRGRNANAHTSAKNAKIQDYRRATGLEALVGYLYLSGQNERLLEILRIGVKAVDTETGARAAARRLEEEETHGNETASEN